MSRYQDLFADLKSRNEAAFVPFVVLGDPNPDHSLDIINGLVNAGADALELGFPFSDPLADGPTIQGAMERSLAAGTNPAVCFEILKKFRSTNDRTPIGLLVYANLVHSFGIQKFYKTCCETGVDSVLVADVPVSESKPFCKAAKAANVAPIMLCPPNVDLETMERIATQGEGYTYLLSRAGVTGTGVSAEAPVNELLKQLTDFNAPPSLSGFGISKTEHVKNAIAAGAAGVIVGSAIVQILQENLGDIDSAIFELGKYVVEMKSTTRRTASEPQSGG